MNLQDIISLLESANPSSVMEVGFADFASFRGSYKKLAFVAKEKATVGESLDIVRKALARGTMFGYKGGEYEITGATECVVVKDRFDPYSMFDVERYNGVIDLTPEHLFGSLPRIESFRCGYVDQLVQAGVSRDFNDFFAARDNQLRTVYKEFEPSCVTSALTATERHFYDLLVAMRRVWGASLQNDEPTLGDLLDLISLEVS